MTSDPTTSISTSTPGPAESTSTETTGTEASPTEATPTEWSLTAVVDIVTDVAPDRDLLVGLDRRFTYRQVQQRSRSLGAFLVGRGLGAKRERAELERWECGQSPVAIVMSNAPEYVESMYGAFRARAVPFNVNHHYNSTEVASLLDQIGAEAIIYHRRFAPLLAEAAASGDRLLIDLDDGSGVDPLPGSIAYEAALAEGAPRHDTLPTPSPDDLYMICTGGTTGSPKGVLWRQADVYVGAMNGRAGITAEEIAAGAQPGAGPYLPAPPLMHGAAQWTAFSAISGGGTVVLHDDVNRFDAHAILSLAAREKVVVISIVGEAFARPFVEELRSHDHDLSSLFILGTGGAATSEGTKAELLELLPHLMIADGYGASETGGAGYATSTKDAPVSAYAPTPGTAVVSHDLKRFLEPGDDELGWAARGGHIPLGYLDDPTRTEATFPVVEGRRVSVPGDLARIEPDGNITLLGRDAMVINTGGEKVFVEEVESALRTHPDIDDALVVGRPHDRLGHEVVALVALHPGAQLSAAEVREIAAATVARFKAPRAVAITEEIGRLPTGKPDYAWAREMAASAVDAI